MAANAFPNPNVTIDSKKAVDHEVKKLSESALPVKERVTKVLREVFEGQRRVPRGDTRLTNLSETVLTGARARSGLRLL